MYYKKTEMFVKKWRLGKCIVKSFSKCDSYGNVKDYDRIF